MIVVLIRLFYAILGFHDWFFILSNDERFENEIHLYLFIMANFSRMFYGVLNLYCLHLHGLNKQRHVMVI